MMTTTFDATSPVSSALQRHPHLARIISRRWKELEPLIRMRLGLIADITPSRSRHSDLVTSLLSAGIEMRTIRRLDLDDIRCTPEELRVRSELYLDHHHNRRKATSSPEREMIGNAKHDATCVRLFGNKFEGAK